MTETKTRRIEGELPPAPQPLGSYVALNRVGDLVFLSGMLPVADGVPAFAGRLDKERSRGAARLAALNALAVLREHFGALDHVRRLVRMAVYIATDDHFRDHAYVADGASEVFDSLFSERHARLAFGVSSLPMNCAVELELIFQVCEVTNVQD